MLQLGGALFALIRRHIINIVITADCFHGLVEAKHMMMADNVDNCNLHCSLAIPAIKFLYFSYVASYSSFKKIVILKYIRQKLARTILVSYANYLSPFPENTRLI